MPTLNNQFKDTRWTGGANDLADNSVTTSTLSSKIADGAVTTPKIALGAITADRISPGALRVQITEKRSVIITIAGSSEGGAQVFCNAAQGEVATGGGFIINDPRVIIRSSHSLEGGGNSIGWNIFVSNMDTTASHTIQASVQCEKLLP